MKEPAEVKESMDVPGHGVTDRYELLDMGARLGPKSFERAVSAPHH